MKFGVELVYYCTGLDTTCSYRSVNMLMERVLSRPGMRCEHAVRLQVRGSFLSRPRLAQTLRICRSCDSGSWISTWSHRPGISQKLSCTSIYAVDVSLACIHEKVEASQACRMAIRFAVVSVSCRSQPNVWMKGTKSQCQL